MKKSYFLGFAASLILLVAAFLLRERLSDFKSLGLLGIFLINLLGNATLFLPAPAIASVIAGGLLYPAILVALAASLGASLGDMVGFFLGISGKALFIKNHHKWYMLLQGVFKKYGGFIVFIVALIPNPFFDVIGILAGVFSFSFYRFFIPLFLGRLIRNLLLAHFGSLIY